MDGAWTKTSDEVLSHFSVSRHGGLSTRQAGAHATQYGKNGGLPQFANSIHLIIVVL